MINIHTHTSKSDISIITYYHLHLHCALLATTCYWLAMELLHSARPHPLHSHYYWYATYCYCWLDYNSLYYSIWLNYSIVMDYYWLGHWQMPPYCQRTRPAQLSSTLHWDLSVPICMVMMVWVILVNLNDFSDHLAGSMSWSGCALCPTVALIPDLYPRLYHMWMVLSLQLLHYYYCYYYSVLSYTVPNRVRHSASTFAFCPCLSFRPGHGRWYRTYRSYREWFLYYARRGFWAVHRSIPCVRRCSLYRRIDNNVAFLDRLHQPHRHLIKDNKTKEEDGNVRFLIQILVHWLGLPVWIPMRNFNCSFGRWRILNLYTLANRAIAVRAISRAWLLSLRTGRPDTII